jgi:Cu2+-exporting ATPase
MFGEDILQDRKLTTETVENITIPEGSEAFLRVDGIHCSSCEILIKKLGEQIEGIQTISISYATSTAKVIYDPGVINLADLPALLSSSGYKAYFHSEETLEIDENKILFKAIIAVALAGWVMMLNLAFFYPVNLGLIDVQELEPVKWLAFSLTPRVVFVFTTLLIFVVGFPVLRGAWIGIRAGFLNMDNLLTVAILAAYGFSVSQMLSGEMDLYFDVAAVIVAVVTIGRYFEQKAKTKATVELNEIIKAWSPEARILRDGEFSTIKVEELSPGDHVYIDEGEAVPVNGIVIKGQAAINESLMTGEPFPQNRGPGDKLLGGAKVVEGKIVIEIGSCVESQMDNLAQILWNIQSSTTGIPAIADKIARVFVPLVLFLSGVVTIWMLHSGTTTSTALLAGLTTLIVSCPCTFGLAVPLATASALSTGLQNKIIFTSSDIFEKPTDFDIVAIDKTGTLSAGEMRILDTVGPPELVEYAAAVERLSSHPIAKAIASLNDSREAKSPVNHPGKGTEAVVDGKAVAVGSKSLFAVLGWEIPLEIEWHLNHFRTGEQVISYVGWDHVAKGAIITGDQQRPEWEAVLKRLGNEKYVVLLTGAENPGDYSKSVDECFAGVPPEAKAAVVEQLKSRGSVVMIGDGSNDAPALAAANLGIAFGTPTSLAAEAADIVIPGNRLERIFLAFDIIRTTRLRIRQNIGWAFIYNLVAIPLALTGMLNPLFAALAMASSSLLVVWNSSRSILGLPDFS